MKRIGKGVMELMNDIIIIIAVCAFFIVLIWKLTLIEKNQKLRTKPAERKQIVSYYEYDESDIEIENPFKENEKHETYGDDGICRTFPGASAMYD
jgi:Tfp pilus assembly protein PilO